VPLVSAPAQGAPIRVAIIGVPGRMGCALVRAAAETPDMRVAAAVASPSSAAVGRDAGELAGVGSIGVGVTNDLAAALACADVVIDFSNSGATATNLAACRTAGRPLLIGTTGFAAELAAEIDSAAREIPLLVAPNTSVGITLLLELVQQAARALPSTFDIEIIEAHHRTKRDAPSGTALALGNAAATGRRGPERPVTRKEIEFPRHEPRRDGDIGFAVIRGGDIVGEHTVLFAGAGERISLGHSATDRAIFARGALQAARWLQAQPQGRYFMRDILGYKS
jgi:4-hydroxy-tetrahydrodipicolinate reductase